MISNYNWGHQTNKYLKTLNKSTLLLLLYYNGENWTCKLVNCCTTTVSDDMTYYCSLSEFVKPMDSICDIYQCKFSRLLVWIVHKVPDSNSKYNSWQDHHATWQYLMAHKLMRPWDKFLGGVKLVNNVHSCTDHDICLISSQHISLVG